MLKKILSLVLNSNTHSKHPVKTTTINCGGNFNNSMFEIIMNAQKRKAKQIDDYIFEEYEE